MGDGFESAKERAWREIADIDAAHARGDIDDKGWHAAMAQLVVPAYFAAANEREGSGHSGSGEDWAWSRGVIAEAIDRAGTFLDVGCANGLLMDSLHRWTGIEPYGLDISPELAELARQRYPHWADRIFVGNALDWTAPLGFTYARTGLEYVPRPRRALLITHLLAVCQRLIVGKFNEDVDERALEREGTRTRSLCLGFPDRGARGARTSHRATACVPGLLDRFVRVTSITRCSGEWAFACRARASREARGCRPLLADDGEAV